MILPTQKFENYTDVNEWLKSLDCHEISRDDFNQYKDSRPQVSRYMLQKQLKVCSFTYLKDGIKSWMFFIPVKVIDRNGITHNLSLIHI